jgi:hypothetical protein
VGSFTLGGSSRRWRLRRRTVYADKISLGGPRRRRFAGAERGSRVSQGSFHLQNGRVRAAEHAPRDPFRLLERRHGLAGFVDSRAASCIGCKFMAACLFIINLDQYRRVGSAAGGLLKAKLFYQTFIGGHSMSRVATRQTISK